MKIKAYWHIDKVNECFAKRIRDILNEDTEVLLFVYEINEDGIVTDVCFEDARTGGGVSLVEVTGEQRRLVEDAIWGEVVGVINKGEKE